MTLHEIYLSGLALAGPDSSGSRSFDISCLFEEVFGVSRLSPSVERTYETSETTDKFFAFCRRYAAGEPLQYLLGEWEFYGLPFFVGPGVLIPQPDTETLVETALEFLRDRPSPTIADLCSGSGCVAIAIAHLRPDACVFAAELSDEAFPYLERNIVRNKTTVQAIHTDVLSSPPLPPLDLVVSNPPYLTRAELLEISLQVRQEPEIALLGGEDGLSFYRALPKLYFPLLKPGGMLALEVGYTQAATVARLLSDAGYQAIQILRDLAGIQRVVAGRRPLLRGLRPPHDASSS